MKHDIDQDFWHLDKSKLKPLKRINRCCLADATDVEKEIQRVVRRAGTNPEVNDDGSPHKRPQFHVQLTEIDCGSDYSINTPNHSTNTTATGCELLTFLTGRSQERRHKRESLPAKNKALSIVVLVTCQFH